MKVYLLAVDWGYYWVALLGLQKVVELVEKWGILQVAEMVGELVEKKDSLKV
jgi:hypothetical protein